MADRVGSYTCRTETCHGASHTVRHDRARHAVEVVHTPGLEEFFQRLTRNDYVMEDEETATNALVTGPPRSGKTTVIERTVARLRDGGVTVGGIVCPELRTAGDRVGFEIVDIAGGRREVMAHVDFDDGPSVGKYGVDTEAVDAVAARAIPAAVADADCVVIDEIAPMELTSDRFVAVTRDALEDPTQVLAAIADNPQQGFLREVSERHDVTSFRVTTATREDLPAQLETWVLHRDDAHGC